MVVAESFHTRRAFQSNLFIFVSSPIAVESQLSGKMLKISSIDPVILVIGYRIIRMRGFSLKQVRFRGPKVLKVGCRQDDCFDC